MNLLPAERDPPRLLLVDDDLAFCSVLAQAFGKRGFQVVIAHNVAEALARARENFPAYAVVDLRMPGESGLEVVASLCAQDRNIKLVVLTGYASIATAVEAVKLGATHYLTKPADADEIMAAFNRGEGDPNIPVTSEPVTIDHLEWEHIHHVLAECGGNISAAARRLGMYRRTLQRKLGRGPLAR